MVAVDRELHVAVSNMPSTLQRPRRRIQVDADVRIDDAAAHRGIGGHLLNLSVRGAFVGLDDGYPVGTGLRLQFKLPTLGEISCRVIVRHNRDGKGIGVEFLDLEGTEQARRSALVAEHQA